MRHDRIPQEAVIGLVYAITAALAILVVQKTHGAEQMESILVGSLLWVQWSEIIPAGIAYAVIGGAHLLIWRKLLAISDDPEEALRRGTNVRLWAFVFYASFRFVITFSVRVAGVLLVFVFLVAPAIMAVMITRRFGRQLLVGWAAGAVVTLLGLYLSYRLDLPCAPSSDPSRSPTGIEGAAPWLIDRESAPRTGGGIWASAATSSCSPHCSLAAPSLPSKSAWRRPASACTGPPLAPGSGACR